MCFGMQFHQTKEWITLARTHKAICRRKGIFYCVECKSTTELESAHCWPQKKYPEFSLWLINLRLRCRACNQRMGQRVYWDWQTLRVILYYAVRLCLWPTIIATALVWQTSYPFGMTNYDLSSYLQYLSNPF